MSIVSRINAVSRQLLLQIPFVNKLNQFKQLYDANSCYPPGFYSSAIVNVEELKQRQKEIWNEPLPEKLEGIELNTGLQLELAKKFETYYNQLDFQETKTDDKRYWFQNIFYSYTDAIVLSCMMHHARPERIIEIGSGFSSAVMLDTADDIAQQSISLTFIEPYTERLESILKSSDKSWVTILNKDVQSINLNEFENLKRNDIIFVDSSHVAKTGSDLNFILFQILPALQTGVLIHFHDIFFPFEYPKEWVFDGRNWNENYIIRAFLMHNEAFEIVFFSHYLHQIHPEAFHQMPLCYKNQGGNLWLRKK